MQRQLLRSIKLGQNIGSQNLADGAEGFGTSKGHRDHSMTGAGEPLSPALNPSRPKGPHSSSLTGLVPGSATGDGDHRKAEGPKRGLPRSGRRR